MTIITMLILTSYTLQPLCEDIIADFSLRSALRSSHRYYWGYTCSILVLCCMYSSLVSRYNEANDIGIYFFTCTMCLSVQSEKQKRSGICKR